MAAVMMGGISLGPVLSGIVLEHFWWGSVFLVNTPAMVLLLVLVTAGLRSGKVVETESVRDLDPV